MPDVAIRTLRRHRPQVSPLLLAALVAVIGIVWGPSFASAQPQAPASMVQSDGHRVNESTVIVPVAGFELGFDSNVLFAGTNPKGAALMRVLAIFELMSESHSAAQLTIAAPDAAPPSSGDGQTVDFKAGLSLAGTQYLDDRERVRDQSNLGVTAHADVVAFPHARTTFFISDNFVRDTRPQDFGDFGSLNRNLNHLKLGMRHKIGPGAIRLGLRYENKLDLFESSGLPFSDRIQHLVAAKADWQFLPITKFYAEASGGIFTGLGQSPAGKATSLPLRVLIGGASAITQSTTVRTHIGFGKGFYSSGPEFMNVLFGAELGVRYSPFGRVTLAYRYDFYDAVIANFYRDHSVNLKLDQQFGRTVLSAAVNARLRGYRGIPMSLGPSFRDDVILAATGRGHYMIRDWLAAVASVSATTAQTDYVYNPIGGFGVDDPSYARFEASLGVRAAY